MARCEAGEDQFPGDVYVGRFRTEPSPLRPVDFALAELAPDCPWQLQAPEENRAYAEAMAAYTQAAEAKKVDSSKPLPAKPSASGAVGGASRDPEGEMHQVGVGAGAGTPLIRSAEDWAAATPSIRLSDLRHATGNPRLGGHEWAAQVRVRVRVRV